MDEELRRHLPLPGTPVSAMEPLSEMETPLLELLALSRLVAHLTTSVHKLENNDLLPIARGLGRCHEQLQASWEAAFECVRKLKSGEHE